jgi:hypothetical protein
MSKKKLLIHEVFEKARKDFPAESTKNGWCRELVDHFEKKLKFIINEKTFVRYYDACLRDNTEPNIKDIKILNKLSEYLGYIDFTDFSRTFVKKDEETNKTTVKISVDEDEETLTEKLSNIIINITNEQHFKMPEFVKQNGLGIVGLILIGSVFAGNYRGVHKTNKREAEVQTLGFFMGAEPIKEKSCMYWSKTEYKLAECGDKTPRSHQLIPIDSLQLKHFKKITKKDTLTVDNALGVTWYSKFYGNVEFFTMDGRDPDNGRELRASTPYIIEKYAGAAAE